jgi:glycosyltransferase involved in cell wall biosynthesis
MVSLTQRQSVSISIYISGKEFGAGGAEQVVLNLAQGFVERGIKPNLVLLQASGAFVSRICPDVHIVDLSIRSEQSHRSLRKLFALIRYLKREQPTIFFAVSDTENIAMWAKRIAGVKTSVLNVLQVPVSMPLKWVSNNFKRYLIQNSYRWVDGVVACSQGVADDLIHTTGVSLDKVHVIYNPIVIDHILAKAQEPIQHPWFTSDAPPVILGIGRLVKQKDFPTLIRAFFQVRQQKQAKLIILGEGEQRCELEALIEELGLKNDVDLPGFQCNPHTYMAKSSLFVLSSRYEGAPNVLLEALEIGIQVVSTDCNSGPADILECGKYGRLTPLNDPQSLADAILEALTHPIASNILQKCATSFSLPKIVDQYLEIANHLST